MKVAQSTPRSNFEEKACVAVLKANTGVKIHALRKLDNKLNETDVLTPLCVREELPGGPEESACLDTRTEIFISFGR